MTKFYTLIITIILLQITLFAKEKKEEKFPSYKAGLQVVMDAAWFTGDDTNSKNQEIRRARLFLKSKVTDALNYEIEYSLTGGGKWKDLYLQYNALPGDITLVAGHTKEPFGLEALTSSKYNTFMERALPDMFVSDRKLGLVFSHKEYKKKKYGFGASVGFFGPSINDLNGKKGKYSFVARTYSTSFLKKSSFFHIGVSAAYNNIGDQKLKLSTRPESHLADKILKSKIHNADYTLRYGLEAAYQYNALSLQSEFLYDRISTTDNDIYNFSGWYAQMSYFFTDDARRYKLKEGVFGRLKPKHSVNKGGIGAWEGALRISQVNLNDGEKKDGKAYQYTLGVNWYIVAHMRMMANYIITDVDEIDKTSDITQLRLQYDF